jgi:hypothetical protein
MYITHVKSYVSFCNYVLVYGNDIILCTEENLLQENASSVFCSKYYNMISCQQSSLMSVLSVLVVVTYQYTHCYIL